MNEEKARKIVYVEKKTGESGLWYGKEVWYECPECHTIYSWLGRSNRGNFCTGCGNWLSWAKLDYENYKQTDSSFDKNMTFHQFLESPMYGHTWENEVAMTYSHSEQNILKGCIQLMQGLVSEFQDYCDYMGWEWENNEEEKFSIGYNYGEIVRTLFLNHTTHSGGTSTGMKCAALGVEYGSTVRFQFEGEEDEEDET